jgi:streptogramin lyase
MMRPALARLLPCHARSLAHRLAALMLITMLAACGGGGGGSADMPAADGAEGDGSGPPSAGAAPATPPTASLTISADRQQTSAGGAAVTLTASGGSAGSVQWSLAPDSPGSLGKTTGERVEYLPPPSGSIGANTVINIVAASGDASATITVVLTATSNAGAGTPGANPITPPAPGASENAAPGVYLLAGNDFGPGMADGAGTDARFDTPSGIARDAQGNLYVADRFNNVVRRIDPQGKVTTLAGLAGARGHVDAQGGDARFSVISGIAVDSAGNVYVDDYGNAVIRKITPDGHVSTLAGSPGLSGSSDGRGSTAQFGGSPSALALDRDGNLYVAETYSIRKVTPDGTVTTIPGPARSATTGFVDLNGIALDDAGNIYVVDGGWTPPSKTSPTPTYHTTALIRKITPSGTISTLAGAEGTASFDDGLGFADGAGQAARFRYPEGLTIDGDGNLYVADRGNQAIRKVTPNGVVTTVAGMPGAGPSSDGPVASARFTSPAGIAVGADGALYVTDMADHTVRRIVPGDSVSTIAGAAPRAGSADGAGTSALFNSPQGLARDSAGNLYVADSGNAVIRRIAGNQVSTFAGSVGQTGATDGTGGAARFDRPLGVAADAQGNLFVADQANYLIRRITPAGMTNTYAGIAGRDVFADGPAASASFMEPRGVAVDADGNVYVADRSADAIRKVTPQGVVSTLAGHQDSSDVPYGFGSGNQLGFPLDVAVDGKGNVYTIDSNTAIRKIAPDGAMATLAGVPFQSGTQDGTGSAARFDAPQGLTVDDDGNLYVADSRAIRKITPEGVVTTVAGATADGQSNPFRSIYRPSRITMTGPKSLAFTSGNGVFELRLP